jgi:hypothetical protein
MKGKECLIFIAVELGVAHHNCFFLNLRLGWCRCLPMDGLLLSQRRRKRRCCCCCCKLASNLIIHCFSKPKLVGGDASKLDCCFQDAKGRDIGVVVVVDVSMTRRSRWLLSHHFHYILVDDDDDHDHDHADDYSSFSNIIHFVNRTTRRCPHTDNHRR